MNFAEPRQTEQEEPKQHTWVEDCFVQGCPLHRWMTGEEHVVEEDPDGQGKEDKPEYDEAGPEHHSIKNQEPVGVRLHPRLPVDRLAQQDVV